MKPTIIKILAALAYIGMVTVNFLANALPINGISTGQISDNYQNLFAPAGLTFSIWGLIYLLLALYTLYQFGLFQADRDAAREDLYRKVGVLYLTTSLINIAWIFAWHYDYIWITVLLMIALLISLIAIANYLNAQKFSGKEKLFILAPFSVYFGWITVATIANITVFLVKIGWGGWGLQPFIWAASIIAVGAVIGIWRMIKDRNLMYGAVFVWAYLGIYIKHSSADGYSGQYPTVMAATLACMAAFVLAGAYLRFKKPA